MLQTLQLSLWLKQQTALGVRHARPIYAFKSEGILSTSQDSTVYPSSDVLMHRCSKLVKLKESWQLLQFAAVSDAEVRLAVIDGGFTTGNSDLDGPLDFGTMNRAGEDARFQLGHDERPPLRGGGEHTEVAHGVEPGRWHERDEAAEQRQRVEVDGDGAVTERLLESDADEAIGAGEEPLVGQRRAQDVLQQRFASLLSGASMTTPGRPAKASSATRPVPSKKSEDFVHRVLASGGTLAKAVWPDDRTIMRPDDGGDASGTLFNESGARSANHCVRCRSSSEQSGLEPVVIQSVLFSR